MWVLSHSPQGWQAAAAPWFLSSWGCPQECLGFLPTWRALQERVSPKIEDQVEAIAPYDLVWEDTAWFLPYFAVRANTKPGPRSRAEDVDPTS